MSLLSYGASPLALLERLVLTFVTLGTINLILVAIYRVKFHPLAKYPGPFLAKITNWYETWHAFTGDRHLMFWKCHEEYGSVVRYGPNSLSFNSSAALKDIYGFKSTVRKADFYTAFWPNKSSYNTHNCIDKSTHARKRRVLSSAFSDDAIKSADRYVLANVDRFCQVLGSNALIDSKSDDWGEAKDMARFSDYLAFDVMGDLAFGRAFELLTHEKNRFAPNLISNAAHRHLICGTNLIIHEWNLDKIFFRKIASDRQKYLQYSLSLLAERTASGNTTRKDIFYHLLNAKDPETGQGFSKGELWGESNLMIVAGSDTTSTAIASTFFYLSHNPRALSKATQEVRAKFQDVGEIANGPKLSECMYLRACIDEAMRLSPPVGGLLPREVLPGGLKIDGALIPAGTVVGVPIYAIHHNPEYFPDPFNYQPERWIPSPADGITTERIATARSAFCPFSVGPRGCIGKGLAYVEMMDTIARTLFLYDMRIAPGERVGEGSPALACGRQRPGEYQLSDTFTSKKTGPLLQFRRAGSSPTEVTN